MATTSAPTLDKGHLYHVFISHSHHDENIAEQIKDKLTEQNFLCCDASEFQPGSTVNRNIEHKIKESDKVILVVSEQFMKSTWMEFEVGVALLKEGQTKHVTIIPVITDTDVGKLPAGIQRRNALMWNEPDFWQKLYKALTVKELSSLVPAGDIANGLAWSYFYGYLKLVLPGIKDRVKTCKFRTEEATKDLPFLDRMMIILPESGYCPNSLTEDDKNVKHIGFIEFKASRAGNINRDYKSSVYKVTHPTTNKEFLVIAEFATPLMSMYEMEIGQIAGLTKEQKIVQKRHFEDKLEEILQHSNNSECHDKYCFLSFEDPRDEKRTPNGWRLSKKLAEKAIKELEVADQVKREHQSKGQ